MIDIRGSVQTIAEADIVIAIGKDYKLGFVKNRYFKKLPTDIQFDASIHPIRKVTLGVTHFLVLRERKKND